MWHPANPVGQPLPSTLSESDAIGPLLIAAKLPAGMPISKYFQHKTLDLETNVKDTNDWQSVQNDPAFLEIALECDIVTIAELVARRKEMAILSHPGAEEAEEGEVEQEFEQEEHYYSSDHFAKGRIESAETQDVLRGEPPSEQPPSETEEKRAAQEQEERLAALGVSGSAKPVRAPARPYNPGPSPPRHRDSSGDRLSRSHSESQKSDEMFATSSNNAGI